MKYFFNIPVKETFFALNGRKYDIFLIYTHKNLEQKRTSEQEKTTPISGLCTDLHKY